MIDIPTDRPRPTAALCDVQGHTDDRRLAIEQVGIRGLRHPIVVKDSAAGEQHTIAVSNIYVDLARTLTVGTRLFDLYSFSEGVKPKQRAPATYL
jgi:GTP cyclohydrolase FolE2